MTIEDLLRIAQTAGLTRGQHWNRAQMTTTAMLCFAGLVEAEVHARMRSEGWRPCAVGQRATQWCPASEVARLDERKACAEAIAALRDDHCEGTGGECPNEGPGCDFVAAWKDAIDAIRARGSA